LSTDFSIDLTALDIDQQLALSYAEDAAPRVLHLELAVRQGWVAVDSDTRLAIIEVIQRKCWADADHRRFVVKVTPKFAAHLANVERVFDGVKVEMFGPNRSPAARQAWGQARKGRVRHPAADICFLSDDEHAWFTAAELAQALDVDVSRVAHWQKSGRSNVTVMLEPTQHARLVAMVDCVRQAQLCNVNRQAFRGLWYGPEGGKGCLSSLFEQEQYAEILEIFEKIKRPAKSA
jgi:hypothetical protein